MPSRVTESTHDRRVAFLASLATLVGCTGHVPYLPDGRRPDVLAIDVRRRLLFVGEGKDSESPHCRATQARLQRYLEWAAVHLRHEAATAVCAVCFGREGDARAWLAVLAMLANEAPVDLVREGVARFGPGLLVAYVVACAPAILRGSHESRPGPLAVAQGYQ